MFHWTGSNLCCQGNQLLCASQVKGCLISKTTETGVYMRNIIYIIQKVQLERNKCIIAAICQKIVKADNILVKHLTPKRFLAKTAVIKKMLVHFQHGYGNEMLSTFIIKFWLFTLWCYFFFIYMTHSGQLKRYLKFSSKKDSLKHWQYRIIHENENIWNSLKWEDWIWLLNLISVYSE